MRYLLFLFCMLLSPFSPQASPVTTITLAYSDVESFPFQMGNGNLVVEPPGVSVDVIEQAARLLNIKINYVRVPGKRVLSQIKANQVNGGFIFSYSQERAQYARYPMKDQQADHNLRIATLDYYFYKLKEQPFTWDGLQLSSIGDVPVGAHTGFSITKRLKESNVNILEIGNTEKLFEMLGKRRLTAIAIQSNIASSYINEHQLSTVERVSPPISTKDYYLIFSHEFAEENPQLVQKIWEMIGLIRDDVINTSIKKYLIGAE
ncbi:transporter substrate-binding domain-containing protein [Vibrio vulnificus]|uniref:substrate-binding periplasmic protein n=1 Tax=Vibrio vulnificus TaxID=672 RepID=UPI000CD052E5|nr:transporter substrate-binding domain-containing protein [Vibrio vulnificus]EGQ7933373.1 transporter substrate-binding domain-containing protein [Vibrio vulnificus]EGQ7951510.1 transporter substrate-binding domain-containing protein [Vibrio vulnificus]EGQ7991854.1 transporter substrate-binding domain-containing protein [Vibrio vulnificus]EGQ9281390.1 transporter substrate-binding domain-containing protein [Vibrio vulnificus]EGR0101023.1 transporter substrate-binding domain-containing protein